MASNNDKKKKKKTYYPPTRETRASNQALIREMERQEKPSTWDPRASQPPHVGVVEGTDHVASFKTGGQSGRETLIADGDYSDDNDGFAGPPRDRSHGHYGPSGDKDRGKYTGPGY